MITKSKDDAMKELINWRIDIDPDMIKIIRFISLDEESPEEPIKLLDITDNTFETDSVDAFWFPPSGSFPYSTMTATVSSKEFEKIQNHEIPLPDKWNLDSAKAVWER